MKIRKPAVAGSFYPSDPEKLQQMMNLMLKVRQDDAVYDDILGIIVPHAGYMYSGEVAAHAYRCLKGKEYRRAVVVSPSHREYFQGISVYDGDAYQTPLGTIEVDAELRNYISGMYPGIQVTGAGHRAEHALEVQLPFLQSVLHNWKLIPLVMGEQSPKTIQMLAELTGKLAAPDTIIVISSDLSHFYNRETADHLDGFVERTITTLDPDTLVEGLEQRRCEACGGGGIASILYAAKSIQGVKTRILARTDSGAVTGDTEEVVGYLSAILYKETV